jgi:hypothetical protein
MRLHVPFRNVTCPYCLCIFHPSEVARRLIFKGAPEEPDEKLRDFLGLQNAPQMGKVEYPVAPATPWEAVLRRCLSNNEHGRGWKPVCPSCHMTLPNKIANGELAGDVIAIIGSRNSGKSNYFGVLLHELEKRYAQEVNFRMFDQETFSIREMKPMSSRKLYHERYGKSLFEERRAVDQTPSAEFQPGIRIPLIYRMEFPKAPLHYLTRPLGEFNAVDLIIFDAAGEDLTNGQSLEQFCRYILRASGIIFLLDPLQLPGVRRRLPAAMQNRFPLLDAGPVEIFAKVFEQFESRTGVAAGARIKVPAAFVLSKADVLKEIVPAGSPLSTLDDKSQHMGGFNLRDCELNSDWVRAQLTDWDDGGSLLQHADKFDSPRFFAVSALGETPSSDLRIGRRPAPFRIADPLLWVLWRRHYLRSMAEPAR